MKWQCIPFIALVLSACTPREVKPTNAEMDRVEQALANVPCVGDLDAWDRRYFYGRTINKNARAEKERGDPPSMWIFDHNIVEVDLRQARYEEFESGRKSYGDAEDPPGWLGIDDRPYKMAFGTFDLDSGRLDLRSCGQNMAP